MRSLHGPPPPYAARFNRKRERLCRAKRSLLFPAYSIYEPGRTGRGRQTKVISRRFRAYRYPKIVFTGHGRNDVESRKTAGDVPNRGTATLFTLNTADVWSGAKSSQLPRRTERDLRKSFQVPSKATDLMQGSTGTRISNWEKNSGAPWAYFRFSINPVVYQTDLVHLRTYRVGGLVVAI